MTWRASVLTLFPETFPGPLAASLAGRALARGIWSLHTVNIRDFATDRHRTVDDTPFGGGPGMVMRPDVVDAALASVADASAPVADASAPVADASANASASVADDRASTANERPCVFLTPRGRRFTQADAQRYAAAPGLVLLCGRYEGIDERVIDARALEERSIGDYVLSGGELAALVVLDAAIRLLPGVMGAADSATEESFAGHLLEYPHYTRPAEWQGRRVPDVLLSGHHAAVAAWRRAEAERITRERRPDLFAAYRAPDRTSDRAAPVASPAAAP
jgi:tRNA (guanine37-N1)-methyltransferase